MGSAAARHATRAGLERADNCGLHNMLLGTLRKMAGLEPDAGVKPLDDVLGESDGG